MRDENIALLLPFSKEEFKEAIMQMHPNKSPSPTDSNLRFINGFGILLVTTYIGIA